MVEPEWAFATLDDLMGLAENFISYIVGQVLTKRAAELKTINRDTTKAGSGAAAVSAAAVRRSGEDAQRRAREG